MSAYQNLKKNVIENNIKNAPVQPYPQSTYITKCEFDALRYHQGTGDMWPLTWANDDNMYTGAGDNRDTPMNFWRIKGKPNFYHDMFGLDYVLDVIDDLPIDPKIYCVDPRVHTEKGVKPAGLIEIDDVLYFVTTLTVTSSSVMGDIAALIL